MTSTAGPTSNSPDSLDVVQRLRTTIIPDQRRILDRIWVEYRDTEKFIARRLIDSKYGGRTVVSNQLNGLGGTIVYCTTASGAEPPGYAITLLGALLTSEGVKLEELLSAFLDYVLRRITTDPTTRTIDARELAQHAGFTGAGLQVIPRLIRLGAGPLSWGGTFSASNWSASIPDDLDAQIKPGDMRSEVRRIASESYDERCPIEANKRIEYVMATGVRRLSVGQFTFVQDDALRQIIESDWSEAQQAMAARSWMAATIMCGCVAEGILYESLLETLPRDTDNAPAKTRLRGLDLVGLIEAAKKANILKGALPHVGNALREFRNLVHPTRRLELGIVVGQNEAQFAFSGVEILIKELRAGRGK